MNAPIATTTPQPGSLHRMVNRRSFEAWISAPPYEYEVLRYPEDETKYAWPGQYRNIAVQLAWEAWCESANDRT